MTPNATRPSRIGMALLTIAVLAGLTSCGGGSSSASATLAIISTNIETAAGSGSFETATEGQTLAVGDKVKADPTGFAELTYHDGSWMRIEASATLTIDELTDKGDTDVVRTSVDIGKSWNRVQDLAEPDDAYEVTTPVGTAAVRGAAFATDCPTANKCTFKVVEGTVVVTPTAGEPVTVVAPAELVVTKDVAPGPGHERCPRRAAGRPLDREEPRARRRAVRRGRRVGRPGRRPDTGAAPHRLVARHLRGRVHRGLHQPVPQRRELQHSRGVEHLHLYHVHRHL